MSGRIVQIIGAVIDVEFSRGDVPKSLMHFMLMVLKPPLKSNNS